MFRGVVFSELNSRFGLIIGLVLSIILFALLHATNIGSGYLAIINMFLFGLMMGLAYYSESILLTCAMHSI